MASINDNALLPTATPSSSVPDGGIHLNVRPASFGSETSQALVQFGSAASQAGQHWGQIAADDMATQFEVGARKLLYGDPEKPIQSPDGTSTPDSGYFGLQGRHALDARKGTEEQLDKLMKDTRGKLLSFDQQKSFDQVTRRYRNILSGKIGEYADTQAKRYANGVNTATIKEKVEQIAVNPNDEEGFLHSTSDMVDAATKNAQLQGAKPGDAMWNSAQNAAKAAAAEARISAIGADDPMRAMKMTEQYKAVLGTHYDNIVDHLRARSDQQDGRQRGDQVLSGAPPPAGDDAKGVLRHFEGFRAQAYQDNGGAFRVGYGSDTVTKADGTIERVTPQTVVTREDAERDLERRAAVSQEAVRRRVGAEAFDKLSPQAKASLTSVTYNYGEGNIPQAVVDAAKTGDPAAIATAIRGLAKHNNGINAGRRASEANNIAPGGGAEPSSQAEQIAEVQAMNLSPTAEASAIARINKSHAVHNAAETKKKAEFKQRTDDELAEALNTGQPSPNPMTERDFIRHLGPEDGAAKFADHQSNVLYGVNRKSMDTMSDVEMDQFVNRQQAPESGKPGYARAANRQAQLRKDAAEIHKARREDPSGAVAQNTTVQAALANYREDDANSFQPVAAARMAAQEKLGIEPEYRSPITKAEAMKLTTPLDHPIPGTEAEAVSQVGSKFRQMFGENAQQAFAYALRARHVNEAVAQQTASVFNKLASGVPLTRSDAAMMDSARADAAERAAVQGRGAPGAGSAGIFGGPQGAFNQHRPGSPQDFVRPTDQPTTADTGFEGSPDTGKPPPTTRGIEDLRKGILPPEKFDILFGTGMAKEILAKYPKAPQ